MNQARESSRRLADLLHRERSASADFLVALADFDRQRLWVQLGHACLLDFLHWELGLSRGTPRWSSHFERGNLVIHHILRTESGCDPNIE